VKAEVHVVVVDDEVVGLVGKYYWGIDEFHNG
jgi:hypothetical protein